MRERIYLSSLVINTRNREAGRDLRDCMAMHRTLMTGFPDGLSDSGAARSEAGLLYRIESRRNAEIRVLVQSAMMPDWSRLPEGWTAVGTSVETKEITEVVEGITAGTILRFKLVANPTRKIGTKSGADGRKNNGKRVELRGEEEWVGWMERKAAQSGFRLRAVHAAANVPDLQAGRDVRVTGAKRAKDGAAMRMTFRGVGFEGRLEVVDRELFRRSLMAGIGPGKAFGYGLLSLAPGA